MIHWAEGLSAKEFKEQLRWFAARRDARVPGELAGPSAPCAADTPPGYSSLGGNPQGMVFSLFMPSCLW